jgi:hypothetical protein
MLIGTCALLDRGQPQLAEPWNCSSVAQPWPANS